MTQSFHQPMDSRKVEVEIKKEDGSIDFTFIKTGYRQWFYDIPIIEWKRDYPHWQDHMKDKRWFTEEMKSFIDANI